MAKYTPGPWNTMVSGGSVWGSGGEWICDPSDRHAYPTDTQRANARLIAAAPDLLAALEAMVAAARRGGDPQVSIDEECDAWQLIDHAIAKAKGEDA